MDRSTADVLAGDPIAVLVDGLERDGRAPFAWIVRWSDGEDDPVRLAWKASRDPCAMARLLAHFEHSATVCARLHAALDDLDDVLGKITASAVGYMEMGDVLWYLRYVRHLLGVGRLAEALRALDYLAANISPTRSMMWGGLCQALASALRRRSEPPPFAVLHDGRAEDNAGRVASCGAVGGHL